MKGAQAAQALTSYMGQTGNRIHNALRKLAADGSSQSAGQKGSRIHTIAVHPLPCTTQTSIWLPKEITKP